MVGIEDCAPGCLTESEAAALAKRTLVAGLLPSSSATAKAPLKASPAAVVSMAFAGNVGTCSPGPPFDAIYAPLAPSLSTIPAMLLARSAVAACGGSSRDGVALFSPV